MVKNCDVLENGEVKNWPQDGRRCAKGEVCLKFVDQVNAARLKSTLCRTSITY